MDTIFLLTYASDYEDEKTHIFSAFPSLAMLEAYMLKHGMRYKHEDEEHGLLWKQVKFINFIEL